MRVLLVHRRRVDTKPRPDVWRRRDIPMHRPAVDAADDASAELTADPTKPASDLTTSTGPATPVVAAASATTSTTVAKPAIQRRGIFFVWRPAPYATAANAAAAESASTAPSTRTATPTISASRWIRWTRATTAKHELPLAEWVLHRNVHGGQCRVTGRRRG